MLGKLNQLVLASSVCLTITCAQAIEISPQNNGSGKIPNGYDDITFVLKDGQWTQNVNLPNAPLNNDVVIVKSEATYKTYVDGARTDLNFSRLILEKNEYYKFRYNSSKRQWIALSSVQYPVNESRSTNVKITNNNVSIFRVKDGQWTKNIVLPNNVSTTKFVYIISNAGYPSTISASGKNYNLVNGQSYLFMSNSNGQWRIANDD